VLIRNGAGEILRRFLLIAGQYFLKHAAFHRLIAHGMTMDYFVDMLLAMTRLMLQSRK
jgi:DNA-binding GntR family transcriptional regulator